MYPLSIRSFSLNYKEELLKRIGDGRKTARSIAEQILDTYDNIAALSGASLEDIYKGSSFLCPEVKIVGPDLDYMLDSVAKLLNTCESDNIDDETIINATSIQVGCVHRKLFIIAYWRCFFHSYRG